MKTITAAEAWFSFNGVLCLAHKVRMVSPPVRPHPARKGEYKDIPGTDGQLWEDGGGYKNIVIAVHCIAEDDLNIDDISIWLAKNGKLIFGDEPNRVYHARVTAEYVRNNLYGIMRGQEFTVAFDCEPFRYNANALDDAIEVTAEMRIVNPGTIASAPLLKVIGYGDGTLMIGQNTLIFSDLSASAPVYVDCEAKVAYTGTGATDDPMLLATQHVTGEWMRIEPGENFVNFTESIASVTIFPRWRWL